MIMNKKPNDPNIWNKKPEKSIVVSTTNKCPKCKSDDLVQGFQFKMGEPEIKWLICDDCGKEWKI